MEHLPFWVEENRFFCICAIEIVPNATFIGSVSIETIIKAIEIGSKATFIGSVSIETLTNSIEIVSKAMFIGSVSIEIGIYKVGI